MRNEDKENLKSKQLTESLLIACLAACEPVINKNAYLEKKWKNYYVFIFEESAGEPYKLKRQEWMEYREKIRSLLLPKYSVKKIIQMTKSCTDKATQKAVKELVELIDSGDYQLL